MEAQDHDHAWAQSLERVETRDTAAIERFLTENLPQSASALGYLRELSKEHAWVFYRDSEGAIQGVFVRRLMSGFCHCFSPSASVTARQIREHYALLEDFKVCNSPYVEHVTQALREAGSALCRSPVSCHMYTLPPCSVVCSAGAPEGSSLVPMSSQEPRHLEALQEHWSYARDNGGAAYLADCLQRRPAYCLETEQRQVVAFVMTHSDRSIGALWVHEAWRRRGAALCLMGELVAHMRRLEYAPVFTQVVCGNQLGERFFHRLGFTQETTVAWFVVLKK